MGKTIETAEFVRLVTESQRPLLGYVYALVGNWTDAEDVLQETNVRLWEQQERYDPEKPFMAWARTIAKYMVMAHRSKQRRERMRLAEDVVDLLAVEAAQVEDELTTRRRALSRCMDKLSRSNRRVLQLCYFGGLSMKDAAAQLGRSEAATYKAVSRLRKQLQRCIESRLAGGAV